MKKLTLVIAFITVTFLSYAQKDTITHIDGNKILCRIQLEDSSNVYISIIRNNQEINTYVPKSQIKSIGYYTESNKAFDIMSIGLGLGLDYGGIGESVLVYPQKNIGLFLGIGYAITGLGYNAGFKARLVGDNNTSSLHPYLIAMYGYHAVIKVSNAKQLNKTFYGPTFGFGFDLKPSPAKRSYWTFGLLIPIRGTKVQDYMSDLKDDHGVEFKNTLLPIAISVGYRLILE